MTEVEKRAVQQTDDEKIRAVALDYMEGWYKGDAGRMERALHPDLAKRAYVPGSDGKPHLLHLSALALVQFTRLSNDRNCRAEVRILDRFQGSASVRATMTDWVDYMHIVRVGAEWKIINILWEYTESEWVTRGGTPGERTRSQCR